VFNMAQMKAVKEAVKDSLVGSEETSSQISAQTRARFTSNAIKDPETGELYMGPDEFIAAVAPPSEDYVSVVGVYDRAS
jgi:solute carrier family 25 aspartate/glutamate transporter 12/13